MTVDVFIILLSIFAIGSSCVTAAVKSIINRLGIKYSSTLLACIISFLMGICGTSAYFIAQGVDFKFTYYVYMVLMGFASGLVCTTGYDYLKKMFK